MFERQEYERRHRKSSKIKIDGQSSNRSLMLTGVSAEIITGLSMSQKNMQMAANHLSSSMVTRRPSNYAQDLTINSVQESIHEDETPMERLNTRDDGDDYSWGDDDIKERD